VNPPGSAVSGLRVAIEMLQGKEVDTSKLAGPFGNSLYIPIPGQVTDENFDAEYAEIADQPDSYVLDGMITQQEAAAFMAP
jgi:ribose transport system substrate-binding protein